MKKNNDFEKELGVYRKQIDKVDNKIIKLVNKRGKLAQKIGNLKKKFNEEIFQPEREKDIIERLKNKSIILTNLDIKAIWREIFSACKFIQDNNVPD